MTQIKNRAPPVLGSVILRAPLRGRVVHCRLRNAGAAVWLKQIFPVPLNLHDFGSEVLHFEGCWP